jgi:hypothetical protein
LGLVTPAQRKNCEPVPQGSLDPEGHGLGCGRFARHRRSALPWAGNALQRPDANR